MTNAYGGATQTVRVAAGGTATYTADLSTTGRWYDVKVTSGADTTFLRRFAGHVETGAPGISDPAIKTV